MDHVASRGVSLAELGVLGRLKLSDESTGELAAAIP
jgi:hypothetical protein